jgi:hypothetical protein
VCVFVTSALGKQRGRFLDSHCPAEPSILDAFQANERPCLKKITKVCDCQESTPHTHAHAHTHTHTHMYAHTQLVSLSQMSAVPAQVHPIFPPALSGQQSGGSRC